MPEFSGRCVVTGVAEPRAQPLMQCVGVGLILDDVNAVVLDQAWKSIIDFIFAFPTATRFRSHPHFTGEQTQHGQQPRPLIEGKLLFPATKLVVSKSS